MEISVTKVAERKAKERERGGERKVGDESAIASESC